MSDPGAPRAVRRDRRFALVLLLILLGGSVVRLGYTWRQAAVDPWFDQPVIDARHYVEWATALVEGHPGPAGAYYLAPLYPHVLALWIGAFGRSYLAIYALQHALIVASAAWIALGGRRVVGGGAALAAAALLLLHPPILFFAARPLGESVAIFLLVGAVVTSWRPGPRAGFAAGLLAGLASLARPNLLLVPLIWGAVAARRARWSRLVAVAGAVGLAILPVTLRNWRESGHFVPISSNGGLTAYHGNGPGARGIYTHPAGFPLDLSQQRDAATEIARARSGRDLDAVEADAWWGRRAVAARADRPIETAGLVAWRVALTLGNREFGLDYPPSLDPNPLRPTVRPGGGLEVALVPWALLLALAGAGVTLAGWRGTGGSAVWGAILACAATPVLFYFSSRYRLPAAALLTIPAGVGLSRLLQPASPRRGVAMIVALVLLLTSLLVPSDALYRLQHAGGLANRAVAYLGAGDAASAESDARRALLLDADSARGRVVLGDVLLAQGRFDDAAAEFGEALRIEPLPQAATGLAAALAALGRVGEATIALRRALVLHPRSEACWNALVSLLYASGDVSAARLAAEQAAQGRVRLDPRLVGLLDGDAGASEGGAPP